MTFSLHFLLTIRWWLRNSVLAPFLESDPGFPWRYCSSLYLINIECDALFQVDKRVCDLVS